MIYNSVEDYFVHYANCSKEAGDEVRDEEYPELEIAFNLARGIWRVRASISTDDHVEVGFGASLKEALNDIRDQLEADDGWSVAE